MNWRTKHGQSRSKTYRAWVDMRNRCNNPKHRQYKYWGGRGITVCPEWDTFEQFFADMGEAPEGLSLDRRENDKGYYKANCRWATPKEQIQNTRFNRNLTFNGVTQCLSEWARQTGISFTTLRGRLNSGWSAEQALTVQKNARPVVRESNHEITFKGVTLSLSEWARRVSLGRVTLSRRLVNYGWSIERALTTPSRGYTL